MPDALGQDALRTRDPSKFHAFLAVSDASAPLELETTVEQAQPRFTVSLGSKLDTSETVYP